MSTCVGSCCLTCTYYITITYLPLSKTRFMVLISANISKSPFQKVTTVVPLCIYKNTLKLGQPVICKTHLLSKIYYLFFFILFLSTIFMGLCGILLKVKFVFHICIFHFSPEDSTKLLPVLTNYWFMSNS